MSNASITLHILFRFTQSHRHNEGAEYLLHPHDGVVKLRVNRLQVFQSGFLVEHTLVERQSEASIDELAMVQGLEGEGRRVDAISTTPKHVINLISLLC
jgi:hypothetical protein